MATRHLLVVPLVLAAACADQPTAIVEEARVCAAGPTVKGIDVSTYQGTIDWARVKADGVVFAFIRVSDGLPPIDARFDANWAGARAAGVVRGAYQFFRQDEDAVAQADLLLDTMGPLEPDDLPPVIDVESTDGQTTAALLANVGAWMGRVQAATGRRPILYTGPYFWTTSGAGSDAFADIPLWIANYSVTCPDVPMGWANWTFWQHSSTGSVDGITGAVDLDWFNGDAATLAALVADSHLEPPDAGPPDAAPPDPCGPTGVACETTVYGGCAVGGGDGWLLGLLFLVGLWRRRAAIVVVAACGGAAGPEPPGPEMAAHWVDPFIGTAGEGNTFPGAALPWGMVSPSPHTRFSSPADYLAGEPLASAGYRAGDPTIRGFGLTHISGAGCPDLGAPVVAAVTGAVTPGPDGYASAYENERAWPGYYAVDLTEAGVHVEATATARAAMFRFHLSDEGNVIVDAARSLSWAGGRGLVRVVSPSEVEGYAETGLFCLQPNRQRVYFHLRLARPADAGGVWKDGALVGGAEAEGDVGAWLRVSGGSVEASVGVSYVSSDNARENLEAEVGARTFDESRLAALDAWEAMLSRARVTGGTDVERTLFYTALYHALLHPSLASDVDGSHVKFGGGVAVDTARPRYHLFSLWDTYRALHPLLTLLYPEVQRALLDSLLAMTVEAGVPPKWELAGSEVQVMVGDPAAIVIADSAAKGVRPDGLAGGYARLRDAALADGPHRPGGASYRALGYVPMDEAETVWGPVSTTLEYALADFALARLGEIVTGEADPALAAQSVRFFALYDDGTGFLRPRFADGSFLSPFDPDALEGSRPYHRSGGPGYVEGTAWTYAFAAPHALAELATRMGGDAAFVARLQRFFDEGKLAMWNEPDLGHAYLFTHFAGEGWRAARAARQAMASFTAARDGIPGNDDAGALSAWYAFSALGIYPDVPTLAEYAVGSPIFDRAELTVSGGTFVIDAPHPTPAHIYVRSGAQRIAHDQIAAGGTLSLTMSDTP